jgi:hypothetical protein
MKMNKVTFVIISTLCLFAFFSCSLLTDPLPLPKAVKNLAPDVGDEATTDEERISMMSDALASESTDDLLITAGATSTASDPILSAAILTQLATRTSEIASLNQSDKVLILTLTTNAVLPFKTLMSAAGIAMNSINNPGNNNGDGTGTGTGTGTGSGESGSGNSQNSVNEMIEIIIPSVFGDTFHVDTTVTEEVLIDMMNGNDNSITFEYTHNDTTNQDEVIVDDTVVNVLLSTVSVAVSSLKTSPNPIELVEEVTATDSNGNTIYDSDGQPKKVLRPTADLQSAIDALIEYFQNGFSENGELHCLIEEDATEEEKEEALDSAADTVLSVLDENGVVADAGKSALKTVFKTLAWLYSKHINLESLTNKLSSMVSGNNS